MEEGKEGILKDWEKFWIASKAYLNSNAAGVSSPLRNSKIGFIDMPGDGAIDVKGIRTLQEYLIEYDPTKIQHYDKELGDKSLLGEENKLLDTFVVPVTINGQEIEVIVNNKGQDIAYVVNEGDGKEYNFILAEGLKDNFKAIEILKITDPEKYNDLIPENAEQLAEKIAKDELPKNRKDAARMAGITVNDKGESLQESEKEGQESEKEQKETEAEQEIPSGVRNKMSEIFEKNPDLNITDLKQMMIIDDARSLGDLLKNDGIKDDGGPVIVLRFKEKGAKTKDRVVLIQEDRKPIEYNRDDDHVTNLMKDKMALRVSTAKDNDSHILYTNEKGETYPVEIRKEPRDLQIEEKERFKTEIEMAIEKREVAVRAGDKDGAIKANEEIRNIAESYGLEIPGMEHEYNKEFAEEEQEMTDEQANLNLGWQALERVNLEIENTINEINAGSIDPTKKQQLDALTEERKMIIDKYGLVIEPGSSAELTESNLTKEEEKKLEENDEGPDGPDPFNPMKRDRW